jgi:hypothetical protein
MTTPDEKFGMSHKPEPSQARCAVATGSTSCFPPNVDTAIQGIEMGHPVVLDLQKELVEYIRLQKAALKIADAEIRFWLDHARSNDMINCAHGAQDALRKIKLFLTSNDRDEPQRKPDYET